MESMSYETEKEARTKGRGKLETYGFLGRWRTCLSSSLWQRNVLRGRHLEEEEDEDGPDVVLVSSDVQEGKGPWRKDGMRK